jgi:hypothetical protein
MAKRFKEPARDPRDFPVFYMNHLHAPLAQMLSAYLFCEPPPYTQVAGSIEPDIRIWGSGSDEAKDARGAWVNSLVANAEQAEMIHSLHRVMEGYRVSMGATLPRFRTAGEAGVWVPFTDEQAARYAPHVLAEPWPEDLGPRLIYVQENNCNSLLPVPAQEQRSADNATCVLAYQSVRTPGTATMVSDHAKARFAERIESTAEWALRFTARLEEVLLAANILNLLASEAASVTTAAVLDWCPWIEDAARLTGCWPALEESRNPRRGAWSLESFFSQRGGHDFPTQQVRAHATVIGFGTSAMLAKAATIRAGWREGYPSHPHTRLVAGRARGVGFPPWMMLWRKAFANGRTPLDLADAYITKVSTD